MTFVFIRRYRVTAILIGRAGREQYYALVTISRAHNVPGTRNGPDRGERVFNNEPAGRIVFPR